MGVSTLTAVASIQNVNGQWLTNHGDKVIIESGSISSGKSTIVIQGGFNN